MTTPPPVAIFDLDGTLVDTAPDLAADINRVLDDSSLAPITLGEARQFLGNGMRAFALRAFQSRQAEATEQQITRFIDRYVANPVVESRLYPDVAATLDQLAATGWRMAVCTNKVQAASLIVLDKLGILSRFDAVCGGDTVARQKPHPQHIEQTLSRAGLPKTHAVMIGDNRADVDAATSLGIPCIFAVWGYSEPVVGEKATRVAAHFRDIPDILGDMHAAIDKSNAKYSP